MQVRAERAESFQGVKQLSLSFPEFSDGNRGRGLLSQEAFGVFALREELPNPPFVPLRPEIDGVADDVSVSSLG